MNIKRISKLLDDKKDLIINEIIINKATREKQVIHGARAYNMQSPTYLRKKTYDYDILTTKPKKSAQDIAKELSRRIGKKFIIEKGKHKGTYKVKLNGETIVDYTQLKKKPKTKSIWGIESRDIRSIKTNAQRLLKRNDTGFRRDKDLDTLNRIKEIERIDNLFRN